MKEISPEAVLQVLYTQEMKFCGILLYNQLVEKCCHYAVTPVTETNAKGTFYFSLVRVFLNGERAEIKNRDYDVKGHTPCRDW
jgi:hypothetical protein